MPNFVSVSLATFSGAAGCQKLGQPLPESYFWFESQSGAPQQTHS